MGVAVVETAAGGLHVDPLARRNSIRTIVVGTFLAFVFWFILFSPWTSLTRTIHDQFFWYGMSAATLTLATITLVRQRLDLKRLFSFQPRHLAVGLVHATLLYALSRFGVWILSELFAEVVPQIQSVYATRTQLDPVIIAGLLALIIAPCEEIFWRGLIVDHLLKILSPRIALVIATGLYCLVHIWAMNPMLLLAALVLGAHWSVLYWRYRSLVPGVVSHLVWDVLIFVVFPVTF